VETPGVKFEDPPAVPPMPEAMLEMAVEDGGAGVNGQ